MTEVMIFLSNLTTWRYFWVFLFPSNYWIVDCLSKKDKTTKVLHPIGLKLAWYCAVKFKVCYGKAKAEKKWKNNAYHFFRLSSNWRDSFNSRKSSNPCHPQSRPNAEEFHPKSVFSLIDLKTLLKRLRI